MDDYWLQANLYLGLRDFDLEDQRPHCFSLLAGQGRSHIFTVELGAELAMWEKAFQRATFLEVQRTGVSWCMVPRAYWLGYREQLCQHEQTTSGRSPSVPSCSCLHCIALH